RCCEGDDVLHGLRDVGELKGDVFCGVDLVDGSAESLHSEIAAGVNLCDLACCLRRNSCRECSGVEDEYLLLAVVERGGEKEVVFDTVDVSPIFHLGCDVTIAGAGWSSTCGG